MCTTDFDVVTMYTVVSNLEGFNAGTFSFALFKINQKLVCMGGEIAQFIQFCVVAFCNDTAIADYDRWLFNDGGL